MRGERKIRIAIRPEEPGDHARVHQIVEAAFGRPDEARLVDRLRGRARPEISLVAVRSRPAGDGASAPAEHGGEQIVGHIYFSPVRVGVEERPALGLAPVSVDPAYHNDGIGSQLCRSGLEACRGVGEPVVFVLGHAAYYPRFGFRPARPHGLFYKDERFDRSFFVAELEPGALAGFEGEVRYRPEFDEA